MRRLGLGLAGGTRTRHHAIDQDALDLVANASVAQVSTLARAGVMSIDTAAAVAQVAALARSGAVSLDTAAAMAIGAGLTAQAVQALAATSGISSSAGLTTAGAQALSATSAMSQASGLTTGGAQSLAATSSMSLASGLTTGGSQALAATSAISTDAGLVKQSAQTISATSAITQSSALIPRGLANLKLWLEPTLSADTPVDTTAVTTYADVSGNGFSSFTGSGGTRPTYRTGVIGSMPGLQFTIATHQVLTSTGVLSSLVTASADVIMCVMYLTSVLSNNSASYLNTSPFCDGNSHDRGIYLRSNGACVPFINATTGGDVAAGNGATYSLNTAFLATTWHTGGTVYMQVNNGSIYSVTADNILNLTFTMVLGRGGSAGFFSGFVGDILVFNAYDATNMATAQDWLRVKYSLW